MDECYGISQDYWEDIRGILFHFKEIENPFVVKDDIESGHRNVIPLWQFGMGY